MATALLVIDVQRSLLDEGPWRKVEFLSNVRQLIDRARGSNTMVVFVQDTRVEPDGSVDSSLRQLPDDVTIRKDCSDSFLETRLHEKLQEKGITKLIVCGMQTDYCIDTTCRSAASLGYEVQLVSDAHSTFGHEFLSGEEIVRHHNRILRNFPALTGSVRTTELGKVSFDY